MTLVTLKRMGVFGLALACVPMAMSGGCGGSIVPFAGVVPAAATNLDGTYLITVTGGASADELNQFSQLGSNATLVISGGLFTRLGTTAMTPTNVTVNGSNFVWTSAAQLTYQNIPLPLVTTVTVNVNLQGNGSLVGTMGIAAGGQTSRTLNVTLTEQ